MKPTLIDTSVWRRHLAGRLATEHQRWMGRLLDEDAGIVIHPWVTAELVLGGLSPREEALLSRFPAATEVSRVEVLEFVRSRHLARRGIGWVDAQLLASAIVDTATLWAIDADLEMAAADLKIQFVGELD